jgi:hypothetical protein
MQNLKRLRGGMLAIGAALAFPSTAVTHRTSSEVTLPAGTRLVGVLNQRISTEDNQVGDRVEVRTTEPIRVGEGTVPAGLLLSGRVTELKRGGRVSGRAKIAFSITQLETEGRTYPIATDPFVVRGKSETKNTLKKVIGGAVVGGVVGGVAGSVGKGVLIGTVLGSGVAVATTGGDIVLVEQQQIGLSLSQSVTLRLRAPLIPQ